MATEIERKYLVTDGRWRDLPLVGVQTIIQGYMPKGASIRMDFSDAAYGFEFLAEKRKNITLSVPLSASNQDFADVRTHPSYDAQSGRFTAGKGAMTRIRAVTTDQGAQTAFLTIKRPGKDAQLREEFELEIPYDKGQLILESMCEHFVAKARHLVEYQGRVWEVDVFDGHLAGLVLAEIEVSDLKEFDGLMVLPGTGENVTAHRGMGNHDLGRDGIPPDIACKLSV